MGEKYEKGISLENLVVEVLQSKGYEVKHNVTLRGRSGVEHQIDVYAEFRAPLHTSKMIVECKSHDKPVGKDAVIKLVYEVQDLGVDKGILVTTSYFTADAVSIAGSYNVDLWDGVKLSELRSELTLDTSSIPMNAFHVKPIISIEKAIKVVDKSLKGFFGRKGYIESDSMLFYPFYEVNIDARIREEKEESAAIVTATLLIDGIAEVLCDYDHKYHKVNIIAVLPTLSNEEKVVFRKLSVHGPLTISTLTSLTGWPTSRVRRILHALVVKEVVVTVTKGQYQVARKVPDPSNLRSISSKLKVEKGVPIDKMKVKPTLNMDKVEEIVDIFWDGHIKEYKIVFYPYYVCKLIKEGKKYIKVIDMQSGEIDVRMNVILTSVYSQLPF